MTQRIPIGEGQYAAVEDGVELSKEEREDLGLLADEMEHNMPRLLNGGVLGLVIRGFKIFLQFRADRKADQT